MPAVRLPALRLTVSALLGLAALAPAPAPAQPVDPDWPCVQRKVLHLSWGQMWSGPPLPDTPRWRSDPDLAGLVPRIAARRTDLAEVRALVAALGPAGGASREERLVELFAGVFEAIDTERARLVGAIGLYARKQRGLSERIDADRLELDALRAAAKPDDHDALDRIEAREDALVWDTRIYVERRQALTYVCESPVILEKRAFAVAKIVEEALAGG